MKKRYFLTTLFSLVGAHAFGFKTEKPKTKKVKARITYYHPYQDKWGSQVACPNTKRAKVGTTVAAHPDFRFGQKIIIPELKGKVGDGAFTVQDRGSWVTKKKASKGKFYVFDVFVANQKELVRMCRENPPYMEVEIVG
tara:strand:- start:5474 stop:5890 length:417 start_codon:yes stop_codon:yes gene_type:complete